MTKVVGALNFSAECRKLLKEYGDEAHELINDLTSDAADTAVKMIRRDSKKRTGAYAKDWTKKQVKAWGFGTSYTVHNREHYRVAHLLEKDHPFKDANGKTIASWKGDGVIAEAQDYTEAWMESEVYKRFR